MRSALAFGLFLVALAVGAFACSGAGAAPASIEKPGSTGGQPSSNAAQSQAPAPSSLAGASSGATMLQIQPDVSTATFTVDEILRGSPNTVVGTTGKVGGEIALDTSNPAATKVGTILVDARTLATDSGQRNTMLHRFILATSQFEYVSFTPSDITGLPATITPGTTYPVKIEGKLTIKDVTRDVSFDASVTPKSTSELTGTATTTISQKDFGITIPDIPFVAGVSDNVKLDLNFVATS